MTTKESIIIAYLEFLMNQHSALGDLILDITTIKMHMPGYEKLVEDYSKQLVDILSKDEKEEE